MLTRHPLAQQFHQWLNQPAPGPTPPPGTPNHPIWYQFYDASGTEATPIGAYPVSVTVSSASHSSGWSVSLGGSQNSAVPAQYSRPGSASYSTPVTTTTSTTTSTSTPLATVTPVTTTTHTTYAPTIATAFPTTTVTPTAIPTTSSTSASTLATVFPTPTTVFPTPTTSSASTLATVFPTPTPTTSTSASTLATVFPTPTTSSASTLATVFLTPTPTTSTSASTLATVFPTTVTPTTSLPTLETVFSTTTATPTPSAQTTAEVLMATATLPPDATTAEFSLIPRPPSSPLLLSPDENLLLLTPISTNGHHSNNGHSTVTHNENIPSHLLTPITPTTKATATITTAAPKISDACGNLLPIDHSNNIARALFSHYNNALTSDVLLVFGEMKFYCHKLVLAAQSEIFTHLLFGDRRSSVLEIPNPHNIHPEIFSSFLHYLYSGTLSQPLTSANILYYIHLSTIYSLPNLASSLLDYLPSVVTKQSLLSLWATSLSLDQPGISHKCQELVFLRTREIIESEDAVKEANAAVMRALVNSDSLNIEEIELFKFLERWAKERNLSFRESALLRELVSGIRFALMSVRELEELQGHEFVTEPARLEALGHVLFAGDGGDATKGKKFRPRTVVVGM